MTDVSDEIYYDPYDFDIDADPYPVWRRMREEQPLYYNDKYDFFALTRFDDVEKVMVDWEELPFVTDTAKAAELGAPVVWDEVPGNVFIDTTFGDVEGTNAAFAAASASAWTISVPVRHRSATSRNWISNTSSSTRVSCATSSTTSATWRLPPASSPPPACWPRP